jgi:SAM-dependent methyltransferase
MATPTARALLRRLVPRRFWSWREQRLVARIRARNRGRSTREIFSEIYETAQWGGKRGEFSSGRGSEPSVTAPYCSMIREFIGEHRISSVVDLGCGDFEVGKRIQCPGVSYVGVDVVPALIERNRRLYGDATVQFECLDIVAEALPPAALCLVRQVFQHLSNPQIAAVLAKLGQFAHVIVTEHYPASPETCLPNLDKPPGPDTRVGDGSGVFLDKPPFDRKTRLLLSSELPAATRPGETLRSFLVGPAVHHGK